MGGKVVNFSVAVAAQHTSAVDQDTHQIMVEHYLIQRTQPTTKGHQREPCAKYVSLQNNFLWQIEYLVSPVLHCSPNISVLNKIRNNLELSFIRNISILMYISKMWYMSYRYMLNDITMLICHHTLYEHIERARDHLVLATSQPQNILRTP